ncbi:RNA-binding domain-containing protein [Dacryopinax primogenitus]|uniref:RNA-binding domain-containing protein n=1 Tax=Dacryopinax primogenitus (strain DJM 731) TaxID=1858805 RepID=M5G162_DACPD|nr:RNA-binding domain-containing protein [Dacryopinax primogenitus]EJU02474.1 RNA-binding domain-containing protein [Dacryopinax primogenitus]
MDTDMKTEVLSPADKKDENGNGIGRESNGSREKDRERSRSRSRDRRDRDSGRSRRRSDHWEPDRRRRRSRSRDASPRDRSRSRDRSRDRRRRRRSTSSPSPRRSRSRSPARRGQTKSLGGPLNAPHEEAVAFGQISKRENRLYVGNLSYDCTYRDLLEFMRGAGEVLFAEVLVTPTGVSKGCGIVEYANSDDAQKAIRELGDQPLLGRPIFIREDREEASRFGATPVPGKVGMAMAGMGMNATVPPPRPSWHGGGYPGGAGGAGGGGGAGGPGNQLYVGNLPYQAGWQDLKDLFRQAGNIIRADINFGADGRPKGSGVVIYETAADAQAAISMFSGYDWYGRQLEVREDRFAALAGSRGGHGGGSGGFRGGRGGFGGGGFRGGFGGGFRGGFGGGRGGFGGPGGGGRQFDQNLYADYSGPDQAAPAPGGGGAMGNGFAGGYGPQPGFAGGFGDQGGQPNQQIMVRNLPWSTANEDLVELFETTGQVELAEILYEGTRSKGAGVVQFADTQEAETAIAKFSQYMYGGRPLDVRFNDRWHNFSATAAKGGQVMPPV